MPENWVWCKIDDLRQTNDTDSFADGPFGSNLKREHQTDKKEVRIIQLSNISDNGWKDDNVKYTTFEHLKTIARCEVKPNDFIIAKMMPAGRTIIMPDLGTKIVLGSDVIRFVPSSKVNKKYLLYVMQSELYLMQIADDIHGIGRMRTSLSKLKECFIPLPPLNEQQRIVSEIERWANEIKSIKEAEKDLSRVIEQTKSEILNLAIRGKLIPQDPCDEPAIELLRQINPAFQPTDTSHYQQLPTGWTICKLEDILDYEQPQAYIVENTNYSDDYLTPVLTAGKSFIIGYTNENFGICNKLPVIIFDDFTTDSKLVNFPFKVKSSAMKILRVKGEIDIQYIALFMSVTRLIGDTHKRYWISEYSKIEIPLPPLREQQRIVTKVSEIFKNLDGITAEL